MQTHIKDFQKVNSAGGTAVAIGNFDGLHKGHQKILATLKEIAQDLGVPSVVYTFREHPINVMGGDLKTIYSNEKKSQLIEKEKIHTLFFDEFSDVKDLSPEEFVKEILIEKLNIKAAVMGATGRFGKSASGTAEILRELGEKYGFSVYIAEPVLVNGITCSSTAVRENLTKGQVDQANKLLGHTYTVEGTVVEDKRLGRTYGYPTANMVPDTSLISLKSGVYATNVIIDDKTYKSITNVGTTSFDEDDKKKIESHILDYSGNLYGRKIAVEFLHYLRDFKNFLSVDELKLQLDEDKKMRKLEG